MSELPTNPERDALVAALAQASRAGMSATSELETITRTFARAQRGQGRLVEQVIIEVKAIVREQAAGHDLVFLPRVVGWTVAGFFEGALPKDRP